MKEYTYKEIGMLVGIALSAIFAVEGFSKSFNPFLVLATIISIPCLILIGKYLDKRLENKGITGECIKIANKEEKL